MEKGFAFRDKHIANIHETESHTEEMRNSNQRIQDALTVLYAEVEHARKVMEPLRTSYGDL